jgi:diamine N-acetyltransferase
MVTLQGDTVYLRALEPEDLEFISRVENDEDIWEVSNTVVPYSRFLIRQYLENARQDIYEAKQLRLAICNKGSFDAVGLIDLYDFDPVNLRAGVGIIVYNAEQRNKGIGRQALGLLINYAFSKLHLHQLYANIDTANTASISLFTTFGFQFAGIKKDWNRRDNAYFDEALYQLIQH